MISSVRKPQGQKWETPAFNFLLLLSRIQTGKLSEFMTTSCFAHLSFLDGKASGSMSRHDEAYDAADDADDERDGDGYVHELRCDDGKENDKTMDGWGGMVTPGMDKQIKVPLLVCFPIVGLIIPSRRTQRCIQSQ